MFIQYCLFQYSWKEWTTWNVAFAAFWPLWSFITETIKCLALTHLSFILIYCKFVSSFPQIQLGGGNGRFEGLESERMYSRVSSMDYRIKKGLSRSFNSNLLTRHVNKLRFKRLGQGDTDSSRARTSTWLLWCFSDGAVLQNAACPPWGLDAYGIIA